MSTRIAEVPLATIWQMRRDVMYPEMTLEDVQLPDDASGMHLGLFDGDVLCSVISLFYKNGELQFRKFATVTSLQGKGYGKQLLQHVFDQARKEEIKRIWCNARTTATGLYEKFGMRPFGETWAQHGHQFIKMQIEL